MSTLDAHRTRSNRYRPDDATPDLLAVTQARVKAGLCTVYSAQHGGFCTAPMPHTYHQFGRPA